MTRNVPCLTLLLTLLVPNIWGDEPAGRDPVEDAAAAEIKEAYRSVEPDALDDLPIGVFDSGTGGLTVLESILNIDLFDNKSHALCLQGDGQADFARESFVFLADQANMPYGNYPVVDKANVLDDLIVKDAWFLMGRDCFGFTKPDHQLVARQKQPVKAIVIACNTATAYGQSDIEDVIRRAGLDIKVIGVIEAGAQGAVSLFQDGRPGSIAVVPTKGTVLSGAYPAAIRRQIQQMGLTQRIDVFQQGAFGMAGAIDGCGEFILPAAARRTTRPDYRGPSLSNPESTIDARILPRYDFDFARCEMLCQGPPDQPTELQLNSVENYLRFHLVSLLEQIRLADGAPPLRVMILGCTHFPFYKESFQKQLERLRNYQENGQYVYRSCLADEVALIDPAFYTAKELYRLLVAEQRLRRDNAAVRNQASGEFFITVPCRENTQLKLDETGWFTYDYKYGRSAGQVESDYRAVPIDGTNLTPDALERLRRQVPSVWQLMTEFRDR